MPVIMTRTELAERLGDALDIACNQPVFVRKHGLLKNVLISYGEYERLIAQSRMTGRFERWSENEIEALRVAEMDASLEHLNSELELH